VLVLFDHQEALSVRAHIETARAIMRILAFASAAEGVDVNFRWRPQLKDPKVEHVLEAAVNGRASALVTHNLRDFQPAARMFKLRVMLPRELLKELEA